MVGVMEFKLKFNKKKGPSYAEFSALALGTVGVNKRFGRELHFAQGRRGKAGSGAVWQGELWPARLGGVSCAAARQGMVWPGRCGGVRNGRVW